jgi:putative ABC transport system permease protein
VIGLKVSWLDVKLGLRMLIRYPGLTGIGGLALAIAIGIGAGVLHFFQIYLRPVVPLDAGDRIVSIVTWDAATNRRESRLLHDLVAWREQVTALEDVAAFRTIERNLIADDGQIQPVLVAEMTAAGFRIARVPPLLGRSLDDADERAGAGPVVVIGYDVWRSRFGFDRNAVGSSLRLGSTTYTVVGVMPEGFAFPVYHSFWIPFQATPSGDERREGPRIYVFGRLAPGRTADDAQAELTVIGQQTAAAFPRTHQHLRPRVMHYTDPIMGTDDVGPAWLRGIYLVVFLLFVVPCMNVAILVYARTATRLGEITLRSALGASRGRIVAQLFTETLVLAAMAAGAGLLLAHLALQELHQIMAAEFGVVFPFWLDFGLSPATVLNVVALTVFAALVAGVVPSLKATGRKMQSSIGQLAGNTRMTLGKTWTGLIVVQVALAVAVLPMAISEGWQAVRYDVSPPGFVAEGLLTARILIDQEIEDSDQIRDRVSELKRRLEAEPGVLGVTYASGLLGEDNPKFAIEIDSVNAGTDPHAKPEARSAAVAPDFFDVLSVRVMRGRPFNPGDIEPGRVAAIVDQRFVQYVLGGAEPIGRRVRAAASGDGQPGPWNEIVGVVNNLETNPVSPRDVEGTLYYAAPPGRAAYPVTLLTRLAPMPVSFVPRLRQIAADVHPSLRLHQIVPATEVDSQERSGMRLLAQVLALMTLSVLLLSAAGIYALMSFTVAQRRREIGIRAALGANPRRIVRSIFARALVQLSLGVAAGLMTAGLLESLTDGGLMDGKGAVVLPAVSALMMLAGLLACIVPARRSLSIQSTEALRDNG